MFVDTSVLVAILSLEDDAERWSAVIGETPGLITTPLVVLEAAMRLSTKLAVEPHKVRTRLADFMTSAAIEIVPIDEADGDAAIDAFAAYGKGRGGRAKLNLADCLSYACAKNRNVRLLYKGNDFASTDLA